MSEEQSKEKVKKPEKLSVGPGDMDYQPTIEGSGSEVKKEVPCEVIPEHYKPLMDCCREFDEGKIDEAEFFARTLQRTGEFMQVVKQKKTES